MPIPTTSFGGGGGDVSSSHAQLQQPPSGRVTFDSPEPQARPLGLPHAHVLMAPGTTTQVAPGVAAAAARETAGPPTQAQWHSHSQSQPFKNVQEQERASPDQPPVRAMGGLIQKLLPGAYTRSHPLPHRASQPEVVAAQGQLEQVGGSCDVTPARVLAVGR